MTAQDFDWASLESDVKDGVFSPPTRAAAKGPNAKTGKYPCQACYGTGVWRGRGKCFACKGQGYFLTSERDRQKAKVSYRASKERKLQEARAAFDEANPGVSAYLIDAAKWSDFARKLVDGINQYGSLTERQVAAVRSMQAKAAATKAERKAVEKAGAAVVDLAPIRTMFETAVGNGYKRPLYRAAGLVISRAPDSGKNPGALYIKTEADEYLGKILGTAYTGKPAPQLEAIAADPKGEAIRHGQRTGRCSCCGRELTAEGSIDAGIGPICAGKWGL